MTRRLPWLDGRPHPRDVLREAPFAGALQRYAEQLGHSVEAVREEAEPVLDEMLASHRERVAGAWNTFGRWMLRAHDVVVDEEHLVELRRLDRSHSLAFAFSHRSYLDGFVLPLALAARRFSPTYTIGGANLDLPVIGKLASQTGMIFIRRSTKDSALYRVVLRAYVAYLARHGANLAWSIEGGRTRTGKLRPPTHGLLNYLADAVDQHDETDVLIVPAAIVYDQLHEVSRMTREAKGATKTPEDLGWLVSMARLQGRRLGRAYLSFGTPIPLRERLAQLRNEGIGEAHLVERLALDASHQINRATPVTVTAFVCLALLGSDRALTFDQVLLTLSPLADYVESRAWPVAGSATLTDESSIRRALHELVDSGVLDCYDAGPESVWQVADEQHLVAAFYRNTIIHVLVGRAIGEIALLEAADTLHPPGAPQDPAKATKLAVRAARRQALALRDLLKFEFFFPRRDDFLAELREELATLTEPGEEPEQTTARAAEAIDEAPLLLSHLVLRPFIDAYHVLADRLVAADGADIHENDHDELLADSMRLGEQWLRQRQIASAESVSLELLRNALKLAEFRGLMRLSDQRPSPATTDADHDDSDDSGDPRGSDHEPEPLSTNHDDTAARRRDLAERRAAFLAELTLVNERLTHIAQVAQRRYLTVTTPRAADAAE
ncbi:MAG: glycerol-3-phosphate acyltransferase [Actinomycetales bacterium]|nr:MAG: glycerol-3-phosphate acyltransferase [Actinomycetales bacterium]